jgi:nucleoside-diphosphate-sugar epimerase
VRILLTGPAGFIGRHLVGTLTGRGHEVVGLIRPQDAVGGPPSWPKGFSVREAGLDDAPAVGAALDALRPGAVLHLAWYAQAPDYLTSPENLGSLSATVAFLKQVLDWGCPRVLGVGTCLEYASAPNPRKETDPIDPRSLYASCKLSAYLMARALAQRAGADLVWARLFHVYGPGEGAFRLIPSLVAALRAGRPFEATAGEQVRDPIHVLDVCEALACLVEPGTSGVFNVCVGESVPLRDTLTSAAQIVGRPDLLRLGSRPYGRGEEMHLVGDSARLRALGWKPRLADHRRGLAEMIAAMGAPES